MNEKDKKCAETEDRRAHLRNIKIDHEKNIDNIVKNFVNDLLRNELGKYLEIKAKTSNNATVSRRSETKIFLKIDNFIFGNKPGKLLTKYFSEWGLNFQHCGISYFEFSWS